MALTVSVHIRVRTYLDVIFKNLCCLDLKSNELVVNRDNLLFSGVVTKRCPDLLVTLYYFLCAVTRTDGLSALFFKSSPSSDVDMEVDHFANGVAESSSNGFLNGSSKHATEPDDCDADMGG